MRTRTFVAAGILSARIQSRARVASARLLRRTRVSSFGAVAVRVASMTEGPLYSMRSHVMETGHMRRIRHPCAVYVFTCGTGAYTPSQAHCIPLYVSRSENAVSCITTSIWRAKSRTGVFTEIWIDDAIHMRKALIHFTLCCNVVKQSHRHSPNSQASDLPSACQTARAKCRKLKCSISRRSAFEIASSQCAFVYNRFLN